MLDPHSPATLVDITGTAPAGGRLHLWFKAASDEALACVAISVDGRDIAAPTAARTSAFTFVEVDLGEGGSLRLAHDAATTALSVAYVFAPGDVLRDGISVLFVGDDALQPTQAGYHFRPPFGWMNDPNGFGRYHGLGHLFYQHFPHVRRLNAMHWGHAVSDDLIRWRHQPVFLFPSPDLLADAEAKGGCYSGSALALPDGALRVFFTDHRSDREPDIEKQYTATAADAVTASPAELLIADRPDGLNLTNDFRDPFVLKGPDGRWKMLLGSRDRSAGVVLLYDTDDAEGGSGWRFSGVLHRDDRFGMTTAECPCLVPVDGPADDPATRWALIFGLLTSRDPATGRRNLTFVKVGHFDGMIFKVDFEQELDFGTDAYAFQAFPDASGPIGIAWLGNWTEVRKGVDFPTVMTLPRRMTLSGDILRIQPVEAALSLRAGDLDSAALHSGKRIAIPAGAAEIEIELHDAGSAFDLAIACPGIDLGVFQSADGLGIRYQLDGARATPRYIALGAKAARVRILLDAGSIEVFGDDGRWTGTKRLDNLAIPQSLQLTGNVAAVRAHRLAL